MSLKEEDEEKILDQKIKSIKSCIYQINVQIEKNNLRFCLKEIYNLLMELRTKDLSPKNYFQLFNQVFDEMLFVENYFKDEIRRGRKIKDLYDSVQQAQTLLPRIYLLITVGSIYMENNKNSCRKVIFDLLSLVKGIQDPIRGLFTRYYLLKMLKEKLPDKNNEYEGINGKFEDSLKFILQNLEEMNNLWIRLKNNKNEELNIKLENERDELKSLIGENITRLSSLNGLNEEIYENQVLPNLISIILSNKDKLSQEYIMGCLIYAFPDEFNMKCMNKILDTFYKMNKEVDKINLFINLMDKLSKFFIKNNDNSEIKKIIDNTYDLLKNGVKNLIEQESSNDKIDLKNILQLLCSFLNFTINCCPNNEKINNTNYSLKLTKDFLNNYSNSLTNDCLKLINNILCIPLNSNEINIFQLQELNDLMKFLDFNSRENISIKIIESFVNNKNEKIDTPEKIKTLINFIRPIIEGEIEIDNNLDDYEIECQQTLVVKLLNLINVDNIDTFYNIINIYKNSIINGSYKRKKYTFSGLMNKILEINYIIIEEYDNKNNNLTEEQKNNINLMNKINTFNIDNINSDDDLKNILKKFYDIIDEILNNFKDPILTFKFNLQISIQIEKINTNKNNFEEFCANYLNKSLNLIDLEENKFESEIKYYLLNLIVGAIYNFKIFSQENLNGLVSNLLAKGQKLEKKSDQCKSMIDISNLYYHLLNDKPKVIECLSKAKRFAEFAMTNPVFLSLFILLLNKILYFIEIDNEDFIKVEFINDIIEEINNHLQTIKTEKNIQEKYLKEIENYYESTINLIKEKKTKNNKNIYSQINII